MKVILDGLSEDNHENHPREKPDLIPRNAVWEMLHGLGGCGATEEFDKGWDRAIDTAIDKLKDIPGKQ